MIDDDGGGEDEGESEHDDWFRNAASCLQVSCSNLIVHSNTMTVPFLVRGGELILKSSYEIETCVYCVLSKL